MPVVGNGTPWNQGGSAARQPGNAAQKRACPLPALLPLRPPASTRRATKGHFNGGPRASRFFVCSVYAARSEGHTAVVPGGGRLRDVGLCAEALVLCRPGLAGRMSSSSALPPAPPARRVQRRRLRSLASRRGTSPAYGLLAARRSCRRCRPPAGGVRACGPRQHNDVREEQRAPGPQRSRKRAAQGQSHAFKWVGDVTTSLESRAAVQFESSLGFPAQ